MAGATAYGIAATASAGKARDDAIELRDVALRHLHIIARARPSKFLQCRRKIVARRFERRARLLLIGLRLPRAERLKRSAEIVLRPGPLQRDLVARVFQKRRAIGRNRLL